MRMKCLTAGTRHGLVLFVGVSLLGGGACGQSPPDGATTFETSPAVSSGPGLFREVTAGSGVAFTYRNGEEAGHFTLLEALGGGLGVLDFDGDGLPDLFVAGGGYFGGPDKKQILGHPCKLYRNLGGFRFEDVTARVGLDKLAGDAPWFYTHGVAVGDYDRDGWPDLLVTGWGRLALLHNEPVDPADPGRGRKFVDVTARAGLPGGLWSTSAGWGDLDGDGWPDLYVCQYANWSFANHPTDCTLDGKTRDVCLPKRFAGLENKLFRNRGDGTFEDVSKPAGLRVVRSDAEYAQLGWLDEATRKRLRWAVTESDSKVGKALGVLLVDVNGDGKPDVFVANDMVERFLYVNQSVPGSIRLDEQGWKAGVAVDDLGSPNGSMGVDAADYDLSGRPCLWVTNYSGEHHGLFRNRCMPGKVFFQHVSSATGIATIGQQSVGWGTGFLDLHHRGLEDLFLTAGDFHHHNPDVPRVQRGGLFRNEGGGRFVLRSEQGGPYFREAHNGRGAVLADLDNDGRVDLVICHINEPVALLRNEADTAGNHWLGVHLSGAGQRDVVGARMVLEAGGRTQTRFAKGGGSYLSSGDRRHVFGLGKTERIDRLRVIWPSGIEETWSGLAVDRYWHVVEGQKPSALFPQPQGDRSRGTPGSDKPIE
jgi:hypothetical protein